MDENDIEVIQIEIPVKNYERKMTILVETLLAIDEGLFPNESVQYSELEAA